MAVDKSGVRSNIKPDSVGDLASIDDFDMEVSQRIRTAFPSTATSQSSLTRFNTKIFLCSMIFTDVLFSSRILCLPPADAGALQVSKSTTIQGQDCAMTLSMENVGRGGAPALTAGAYTRPLFSSI